MLKSTRLSLRMSDYCDHWWACISYIFGLVERQMLNYVDASLEYNWPTAGTSQVTTVEKKTLGYSHHLLALLHHLFSTKPCFHRRKRLYGLDASVEIAISSFF